MLTDNGATAVAQALVDVLEGGTIRVGNATETASAAITELVADGDTVTARAAFTELEANFDWTFREVLDSGGIVIDHDPRDFGRKVLGAVWEVDVPITVAGAE